MKKLIFTICLFGAMQNVFAKMAPYGSYFNYTQNSGAGGYWDVNNYITANPGDSVVLNVYFAFTTSGPFYYPLHWYFEGDSIVNAGGQQYLPVIITQPGTYSAYLNYSSQGWSNWIYFYVNSVTGITSISNINFLDVYPTTVSSSITVHLNSIKSNDIEISFFDMNGKQLKNDFYKNIVGEFIKNENTEGLAKGIYFLRIKTKEEVVEKKFVKM